MKSLLTGMLFITTLSVSSSVFAGHRPHWTPAGGEVKRQEAVKPLTESDFMPMLSDYHRKRFNRFSPAQKDAAFQYFKAQGMSPDNAVEQVSLNAYLRS
jgi:hypothetical protein